MNVGDKVKMSPMWKFDTASGVVSKITKDYVVVKWNGVPGEWHYTESQAAKLEVVDEKG